MTGRRRKRPELERALLVVALLLLGGWGWLRSGDEDVERGNQRFESGDYAGALESYEAALGGGGDEAAIRFNMGAAQYKLAETARDEAAREQAYQRAETAFRRAAESRDLELKSSAYHNLGNTQFQRGDYAGAVDSYKRALRANPDNDDARYNLELAERKLQRDQQKGGQKGQQQGKQGQEQNQGQQGQQQGQKGQQQGQQGQQGQQQGKQGQEQNQGQQGQQQGQKGQQQGQQGQQQGKQGQEQNQGQQGQQKQDQGQDQEPGQDQDPQQGQDGQRGSQDAQGQPGDGEVDREPKTEIERKLDALESLSEDLRRRKLKSRVGRSGRRRVKQKKDW